MHASFFSLLGRGTSIEAMLAQKKKERMMAKKQQHADTRSKRMAFKEQLEAQSPKVYVLKLHLRAQMRPLQHSVAYIEDITWPLGDTKCLFLC